MIIKTIMLHAAPIWSSTCPNNTSKLQIVQNKCLRMIARANPRDKNCTIHEKLNVSLLHEEIFKLTKSFYEKQIDHLDELHDARVQTRSELPFRIKHTLPYQILIDI